MSDEFEGLIRYFQGKPKIKAWHIVLLSELIGEKYKELKPPEFPPIPKPPEVVKPPVELVEEYAREVGREISKRIPKAPEIVSRVLDRKDVLVTDVLDMVDCRVKGALKELFILSPSKEFRLMILRDGAGLLDRTYSELEAVSQYSKVIDAYEGNGLYVVNIKDLSWLMGFLVTIRVSESITFQHLFAVYDEYV